MPKENWRRITAQEVRELKMKTDLKRRMLEAMYAGKLPDVRLNEDGGEVLDPTPMAPPIGYRKQPSMVEIVRDMIRSQRLAEEVARGGYETFEEADDFEVDEDYDPTSPYENDFEPPVRELVRLRDKELLTAEEDAAIEEEPVEKPASKKGKKDGKQSETGTQRSGPDDSQSGSESV